MELLIAVTLLGTLSASLGFAQPPQGEQPPMTFFITSEGLGDGANLGGLAGADAHCQVLASAVGRGDATWRAYLSTQGQSAVNARDRIGTGPWHGPGGQQIARDLAHLHGDTLELARYGNGLNVRHATTENNELVGTFMGGGPNEHDILTGSRLDGRAYADEEDHTCSNWTSNADGEGSAQVGHHDRTGFDNYSWNSTHASAGCSQDNLVRTGGAGLLYCFAID